MKTMTVNTAPKEFKPKGDYLWLQGIGWVKGKPAGELKVGDVTVWNYGGEETVKEILKETPHTVTVLIEYESYMGGLETSERKLKKTRIVAISE